VSAGTIAGFENSATTDRRGYQAKLGLLYAGSRVANLTMSSYRDVTNIDGSFVSSAFPPPIASSVTSLAVNVPVVASRNFTLFAEAGRDASGGTTHSTFDVRTRYQLTNHDALTASFATGHLGTALPSFSGVGLASDLTFDCSDRTVLGDGPFLSAPSIPATTNTRAGVHHSGARISVNVDAYRDVSRNAFVNVIVPATALSGSLLTGTYLTTASQAGAASCGQPFAVTPANLFYRVSSPVDRVMTDGFDSSASFDIGRPLRIELAYALSRTRAFGSGFPFVHGSNLVAGDQVPSLPLHTESARLTYALSRSTTLLAIASYRGSNNTYRERPFTTIDVGMRLAAFTGDFTVAVQNATNVDAGPFARFEPFPTLATPVAPRTYSVRYRLALGKQGIDKAALLSPPFSLQGGFAFAPIDFETVVRADWLAPDKESPLCGSEQLPQAKLYGDALRAYDLRIQEALRGNPQLKEFPSTSFDAFELSFVRNGDSYAIRMHLLPGQSRKISPFTRCTRVHWGSYDDALRLHLYIPGWQEREARGFSIYYSPLAGVYLAPEGVNETQPDQTYRTELPAHAPANPFAVDEETCPATYRPAVEDALRSLRNYITAIYADGHPAVPAGFTVSRH
ncbi:MAG TPA: hypothetical protein VGT98_15230, partial [Candidatus Elarobacter sp.]|nr:hypothetical protein [Candidatus Elarobacter sp.]